MWIPWLVFLRCRCPNRHYPYNIYWFAITPIDIPSKFRPVFLSSWFHYWLPFFSFPYACTLCSPSNSSLKNLAICPGARGKFFYVDPGGHFSFLWRIAGCGLTGLPLTVSWPPAGCLRLTVTVAVSAGFPALWVKQLILRSLIVNKKFTYEWYL